ncbi:hypothetical protein BJ875DRAFT_234404 [Amylocarpus encephaloides]|uniref:Uncharacterized protein n=1 Tax=Amylocarpus encephaloides TaxID=45428 RepID=A0A9P7YM19_9HELO|nr:hypothetical protein BJ875DRAFT_234404 [Amylocarpus encephaloides]
MCTVPLATLNKTSSLATFTRTSRHLSTRTNPQIYIFERRPVLPLHPLHNHHHHHARLTETTAAPTTKHHHHVKQSPRLAHRMPLQRQLRHHQYGLLHQRAPGHARLPLPRRDHRAAHLPAVVPLLHAASTPPRPPRPTLPRHPPPPPDPLPLVPPRAPPPHAAEHRSPTRRWKPPSTTPSPPPRLTTTTTNTTTPPTPVLHPAPRPTHHTRPEALPPSLRQGPPRPRPPLRHLPIHPTPTRAPWHRPGVAGAPSRNRVVGQDGRAEHAIEGGRRGGIPKSV